MAQMAHFPYNFQSQISWAKQQLIREFSIKQNTAHILARAKIIC